MGDQGSQQLDAEGEAGGEHRTGYGGAEDESKVRPD
jgi:hypothetical protein